MFNVGEEVGDIVLAVVEVLGLEVAVDTYLGVDTVDNHLGSRTLMLVFHLEAGFASVFSFS